ncbi:uncharacterized protein PHALS_13150 [Plasmopara halstedii]|uniref:Uncharacterized protein n=1 Tax=Plasmopara halstedii TaxID=4781 RepID=A0A0N7L603_PLAHL|nr:uncharacterized protein PHALS_13150 [Plasmopara halstedii]CEG42915.1 hypothetical protein PHALS_13150 [Plasmopara halstedii]|eukprot:XP_024579284.1 hypothetical protein PHALS_13150 [Plasmopara halstedii]
MVLIIQLLTETPKRGAFNNREGLVVVDDPLDEGTLTVLPPLILRQQHARSRDGPSERSSSSQTILFLECVANQIDEDPLFFLFLFQFLMLRLNG